MKFASRVGRFRTSHRIRLFPSLQRRGMTLLELTIVILVLLSLITLLFIGSSAWKNGSDRVLCIMNLQTVQKGVRSYANMHGHSPGTSVPGLESEVIGFGRYVEAMPECPGTGSYTSTGDLIPDIGDLYLECTLSSSGNHEPLSADDW
jgi:prepilin-type N-terminal cleavage/methylation domain-containing protein